MMKITDLQMAEMVLYSLPDQDRIDLAVRMMLSVEDPMQAGAVMRHSHEISRHADGLARCALGAVPDAPIYPVTATPAFLPRGPAACWGTFPDDATDDAVSSGAFVRPKREWIGDALGVACLFGMLWVLMLIAGALQ